MMRKNLENTTTLEPINELIGPENLNPYGSMEPAPFVETKKKNKAPRDYEETDESRKWLSKYGTKSRAIRMMSKEDGMDRSAIADALNIRYQHVNNVLNQKTKKPETVN